MEQVKRRGFSSTELVALLSAIGIAAAAGSVIINRTLQAKVKDAAQSATSIGGPIAVGTYTANVGTSFQYHSYSQEEDHEVVTGQAQQDHIAGDGQHISKEYVQNTTIRKAGGRSLQRAAKTGSGGTLDYDRLGKSDAMWKR